MRFDTPPIPARVAREASAAWNVFKTYAQMLAFWFVFLIAIPACIDLAEQAMGWRIATFNSPVVRAVGWTLLLAASALGVWSAWVMATRGRGTPLPFDCPRQLVVAGPYAHVRNPMAIAGVTQGVAVGMLLGSWLVIVYALCGAVLWHTLVRRWEEADLLARFGPTFERYRSSLRCWLPGRRG